MLYGNGGRMRIRVKQRLRRVQVEEPLGLVISGAPLASHGRAAKDAWAKEYVIYKTYTYASYTYASYTYASYTSASFGHFRTALKSMVAESLFRPT